MGSSGSPDPIVFMLNAGPAAIWTNMPETQLALPLEAA